MSTFSWKITSTNSIFGTGSSLFLTGKSFVACPKNSSSAALLLSTPSLLSNNFFPNRRNILEEFNAPGGRNQSLNFYQGMQIGGEFTEFGCNLETSLSSPSPVIFPRIKFQLRIHNHEGVLSKHFILFSSTKIYSPIDISFNQRQIFDRYSLLSSDLTSKFLFVFLISTLFDISLKRKIHVRSRSDKFSKNFYRDMFIWLNC